MLFIYPIYSSFHLLIPNFQSTPLPPTTHLGNYISILIILFICLSVDGHLCSFHVLAIVNNAAVEMGWASLVAQMVKNLPAIWETWVRSLGWEDILEEGMATHSNTLAWRISMDRWAWWAPVHGVAKSQTWLKWLSRAQTRGADISSRFCFHFLQLFTQK